MQTLVKVIDAGICISDNLVECVHYFNAYACCNLIFTITSSYIHLQNAKQNKTHAHNYTVTLTPTPTHSHTHSNTCTHTPTHSLSHSFIRRLKKSFHHNSPSCKGGWVFCLSRCDWWLSECVNARVWVCALFEDQYLHPSVPPLYPRPHPKPSPSLIVRIFVVSPTDPACFRSL